MPAKRIPLHGLLGDIEPLVESAQALPVGFESNFGIGEDEWILQRKKDSLVLKSYQPIASLEIGVPFLEIRFSKGERITCIFEYGPLVKARILLAFILFVIGLPMSVAAVLAGHYAVALFLLLPTSLYPFHWIMFQNEWRRLRASLPQIILKLNKKDNSHDEQ